MAYSTIPKGSLYMNTKLYTGNGAARSITGVGFQPDWVWIKPRDNGSWSHNLTDVVRGAGYGIFTDLTSAQYNYGTGTDGSVRTFDSDGFSLGNKTQVNNNGSNIVAWNWKAGGGQGSSNTDGSTNTIYTSVNTTAGFSISSYTGTGVAGATIGHGLGVVPKMIFVKVTNTTNNWGVYHASLGSGSPQNKYLILDATNGQEDATTLWNDTAPTNQVFSVGSGGMTNLNGNTYISYAFSDVKGYSQFSSYTGNGNADGSFIYTGFKPSWIMIKRFDSTNNWIMLNNKMSLYNNNTGDELYADTNSPQNSFVDGGADFLSNGFKLRGTNASVNYNGGSYVYMCFAENPFVATSGSSAVPVTAR